MKQILFNTEMVKAIIEGRKTETRRVVKPQPEWKQHEGGLKGWCWKKAKGNFRYWPDTKTFAIMVARYAPCQPGDILYVRETTYLYGWWRVNGLSKSGKPKYSFVWGEGMPVYYADSPPPLVATDKDAMGYFKRPSIFMPKEAARTFPKVTDVKMERVQDITDAGAIAEGFGFTGDGYKEVRAYIDRVNFAIGWNEIYEKSPFAWSNNPWVFVYKFERVEVKG